MPVQLLELGGEARPQLAALEVEPQQLLLAEVRLGDRREHPRRHAAGAARRARRAPRTGRPPRPGPRATRRTGRRSPRRPRRGRRRFAWVPLVASPLPPPALPGSGSTVGGAVPPSQPDGLPWVKGTRSGRIQRVSDLRHARLYFVTDAATPTELLRAALDGGVDMVQLRDPAASDAELLSAAERFRSACDEAGALLWVNDRPDLALAAGADGVHVGQDDMPVSEARRGELLVGLSTHSPDQFAAGLAAAPTSSASGPCGRPPPSRAARRPGSSTCATPRARPGDVPWFAIGGIDASNVDEVVEAGAARIVVVRAIRDAADPRAAAAPCARRSIGGQLAQRSSRKRRKQRQRERSESGGEHGPRLRPRAREGRGGTGRAEAARPGRAPHRRDGGGRRGPGAGARQRGRLPRGRTRSAASAPRSPACCSTAG